MSSVSSETPTIPLSEALKQTARVTVLGAGAWGTALARLALTNGNQVQIWSRRGPVDLATAVANADMVVSAISMKGVSALAGQLKASKLSASTILVTATKGLDPETTRTPSKIFQDTFPENPIVVLSGPNLSKEIDGGLPAATVVASTDLEASARVQQVYSSETFRIYTSPDPVGAELGGTLKNVIAIAVGVCDGLKLGSNAKAGLITRAIPEMIRVGMHMGAQMETFYGLSGLGDLLATCDGSLSRNYRVGYGLAQGKNLDQILAELGSTAEGVNTTHVLIDIANREGIPIPIARQVHRLLRGVVTPQEAVGGLMERELKPEACDLQAKN
ncbi:NAD(P)H-dependent glycerol-3-phosphate dehydrogenase [Leptothoe kymatousa]|uniref:Glycerol-3-phosphate dehydrogenase [NAD(P)+] n=1 Tax=Leptothoe kymatousa TAU-MAC 1615 TaxID=2364775 RepID=A0ABS5Y066_9CYAN|nr:NAD(P)H-dependent glycerol-3-phosphate dehydrogenase [Leptothoe kymatousa TAU-MAC 1615]